MNDAELYAYNGWEIIKGGGPNRIDATVPPFGKYLIGLSILLFKNQNIQAIFLSIFLLFTVFLISREVFKNLFWSILPVFFLSIDKPFLENIDTSMLDLPFSVFISLGFYFLILIKKNWKYFLLVSLFFALTALTKMFLIGFVLYLISLIYFFYLSAKNKNKSIFFIIILSLLIFNLIYFSEYLFYFKSGHSLKDFLFYHFWLVKHAKVKVENYPKGQIFNILIFGRWRTWWGEYATVKIPQWNFLWPIIFFSSLFNLFFSFFKKRIEIFLISFWPFSLLLMYATGVPYPRYLLPVLPPLYISFCYNLKQLFQYVQKNKP